MINTSTTISDVIEELPLATANDITNQYVGNSRIGSVFAADADHFFVGVTLTAVLEEFEQGNLTSTAEVSSQVSSIGRTPTVYMVYNDTDQFLPWYTISQVVVDTVIGNTIQVIQASPIRQVWG